MNAVGQLDRLRKHRINQKTRIDKLQERLDHMGTELDSSVDTIRHHQRNYEAQKRRTTMEITHLRNQLAKATALLEQLKLFFSKTNLNTSSLDHNMRGLCFIRFKCVVICLCLVTDLISRLSVSCFSIVSLLC